LTAISDEITRDGAAYPVDMQKNEKNSREKVAPNYGEVQFALVLLFFTGADAACIEALRDLLIG
jgi:hypothetical protein